MARPAILRTVCPTTMLSRVRSLSLRSSPTIQTRVDNSVEQGDAAAFERIVLGRYACRRFDASRELADDTLQRIVNLTQVRMLGVCFCVLMSYDRRAA